MPYKKLLHDAEESIDGLLKNNNLPKTTRAVLETQRVMLAYMTVVEEDHVKVEKMWTGFQAILWASGILGAAALLYFFGLLVQHSP